MSIFVFADGNVSKKDILAKASCSSWKEKGLLFFKLRDSSHCRHAIKRGPWLCYRSLRSRPPSFLVMQILVRAPFTAGHKEEYSASYESQMLEGSGSHPPLPSFFPYVTIPYPGNSSSKTTGFPDTACSRIWSATNRTLPRDS